MIYNKISGFSDEIDANFDIQLKTSVDFGLNYISMRTVGDKNISDYSLDEAKAFIVPKLKEYNIKVSSIASPFGKIDIHDEDGFLNQVEKLKTMCQIANLIDCKYIRMFSFFVEASKASSYTNEVIRRLNIFLNIAKEYNVILIHENERDTFGDTAKRCLELVTKLNSPHFRLVYDFANFVHCDEEEIASYELLKEYIVYIHIKDVGDDGFCVACGSGVCKISEVLNLALNRDAFEGFLTLEPHLVAFYGLSGLEKKPVDKVVNNKEALTGDGAYKMHLDGLLNILDNLEG